MRQAELIVLRLMRTHARHAFVTDKTHGNVVKFLISPSLSLSPTVQNNDTHRLETAQNRVCNDVRAFSASLKRLQNLAWPRNAITADGARVSERASERVRRIGERIVEQCNSIMHAVDEEKC